MTNKFQIQTPKNFQIKTNKPESLGIEILDIEIYLLFII